MHGRRPIDAETDCSERTLISLFSGAGGLDVGLEAAGFETVLATDVKEHACETLRWNKRIPRMKEEEFDEFFSQTVLTQRCHRTLSEEEERRYAARLRDGLGGDWPFRSAEILEADIHDLSAQTILRATGLSRGEPALVAGGPPCQPFSKAGKQKAVDDPDHGHLFMEFARIVEGTRPRWFLFENVKGLTFTKTDVLRGTCHECKKGWVGPFEARAAWAEDSAVEEPCPRCGSDHVTWRVEREGGGSLEIIVSEFERIGYDCSWHVLNAADFGAPQLRERLFLVGSRDGDSFRWPTPEFRGSIETRADEQHVLPFEGSGGTNGGGRPWRTMYEVLWEDQRHHRYGDVDPESAVLWVKNVVRPHDEPVTWDLRRPSPTVGAHQAAKLALAPEGVPEEQIYRQQWHTKGRRQGDTPPVDVEHEYITDEELLKLQTFPGHWYLHGTRMQRAFQVGNAVPPALGRAVGEAILRAMRDGEPSAEDSAREADLKEVRT